MPTLTLAPMQQSPSVTNIYKAHTVRPKVSAVKYSSSMLVSCGLVYELRYDHHVNMTTTVYDIITLDKLVNTVVD